MSVLREFQRFACILSVSLIVLPRVGRMILIEPLTKSDKKYDLCFHKLAVLGDCCELHRAVKYVLNTYQIASRIMKYKQGKNE